MTGTADTYTDARTAVIAVRAFLYTNSFVANIRTLQYIIFNLING